MRHFKQEWSSRKQREEEKEAEVEAAQEDDMKASLTPPQLECDPRCPRVSMRKTNRRAYPTAGLAPEGCRNRSEGVSDGGVRMQDEKHNNEHALGWHLPAGARLTPGHQERVGEGGERRKRRKRARGSTRKRKQSERTSDTATRGPPEAAAGALLASP